MDLGEQLRPRRWEDVIGQGKAVRQIRAVVEKYGHAGSCWWLFGSTGTGKTSIARILAAEYAEPVMIEEFVGRDLLAEDVRMMMIKIGQPTLYGGRVWIVNEAQDISPASVALLLDVIERVKMSKHDMIIFTAMESPDRLDSAGIHYRAMVTRCYVPDLEDGSSPDFQKTVCDYLHQVSAEYHFPCPDVRKLAEQSDWSIRAALAKLEFDGILFQTDAPAGSGDDREKEKTAVGKRTAKREKATSGISFREQYLNLIKAGF